MARHDDEGRDAEDIYKLLSPDANQRDNMLRLDCLTPRPDHCDLLLDAIDQHLDQLQVMSPKPKGDVVSTSQNAKNTENTKNSWDVFVNHEETKKSLDVILSGKEETTFCQDQVIWRLERFLGETCREGQIVGETLPLSESICTDEFVKCFKEEMVDLSPFENMDQLDSEDKTEWTEIFDIDTHRRDQNWQSPKRRGSETSDTVMAHSFQSNKCGPRMEERTFISDSCGGNMSQDNEKAGARERNKTPQRPGDCSSGVASWSFGNMSTVSDLDTDSTEQVSQVVRWTGRCSVIKDVDELYDSCVDHSDNDIAAEEESEVQFTAGRRFSDGRAQKKNTSVSSNKSKTNSDNKDSYEDIKRCIRTSTSTPVRTSERQLSDCSNTKEEVFDLRRKCDKEEKKLRLKWIQLKEVELCLSELRQKKKEAIQQLEQLSADTAQMQKEKRTLEFALRKSRYQLQQLQRQTESCLKTVKTELFAERRHSREKIESLQEQLEELHEELHGATEAGSSLLNRCACQQKQMEKRHQTEEPLDVQVSELQQELGECRIKVGTLDKMLVQLMGLQEERESLQAERDNLTRQLQHLKRQHYRELEEAQEKAQAVMQQEMREEKDQALTSLKEHSEELCSLKCVHGTEDRATASLCRQLQAKELELRQLQMSMAQRKQQTAARLTDSFTRQLTDDLERNASKITETSPDGSTMHGAKESQEAACSHLHHAVVCDAAHVPSDVSLFKLLCNVQSRVKQLQVENQACPETLSFDVSGSSLTTTSVNFPKEIFEDI